MATNVRLMKHLQEINGYAEITNRRPTPRPTVLYLMALRSRTDEVAPAKHKLTIRVARKNGAEVARPVKITHLNPGDFTLPIVIG